MKINPPPASARPCNIQLRERPKKMTLSTRP